MARFFLYQANELVTCIRIGSSFMFEIHIRDDSQDVILVGFVELQPLFEGLGERPTFSESHWWEVQDVPPGFRLLASTDACRVQAFKHESRLLYGVQFHPEAYDEEHLDGKALLGNFFRLAGVI